jgi:hypothetical protein
LHGGAEKGGCQNYCDTGACRSTRHAFQRCERKMAERSVEIPSNGKTTPEYNAVRESHGEINPAIIREDFVSQAYSCGLIPTPNPSSPLDVVLSEISRDPVNYYSLQHVVATLDEGNRFQEGIGKMETTFQCKEISTSRKRIQGRCTGPVSVSQLNTKERPRKLSTRSS